MGRRHLSLLATLVAGLLALAAPAGAALQWRLLADGAASGPPVARTAAYVALTASATKPFSARLTGAARAKLAQADFSKDALIAIVGEFGCRDSSIIVHSIAQRGSMLSIGLVEQPPKAGEMQCMAIYPTYRFLLVAKSQLRKPYPVRAAVTLARA